MSLDQIRAHARTLERRIAWRNGREYVAAVFVAAMFGQAIWHIPSTTIRVASGLIIAGTAFIVYHLYTRGSVRPLPQEIGTTSAIDFLRSELVRQRDLLLSVWRWYLLPLVPGMVLFLIGMALAMPRGGWFVFLIGAVFVSAILFGGHVLNRRAAAYIQTRIDALNHG